MAGLRERISSAAQELYLREGIEGFSMRKVAEMVGVSAPALYRYYDGKGELLNEIVVQGLRILEGYLAPALEAPTPYERLVAMTEGYLRFAIEQPKYFDFAFLTPSREIDRFDAELARPDWITFRLAIDQVAECIEAGVLGPADPLETGVTIWATAHGLVTLFRTGRFGPDEEVFRRLYRAAVHRVLEGLKRA